MLLSMFIKLPFVIKIFVLSIYEWAFYTGFTVRACVLIMLNRKNLIRLKQDLNLCGLNGMLAFII